MIVLVTGGRDYTDAARLREMLDALHKSHGFRVLVHGCASGADSLAARWASSRGIHPAGCPALWDTYGKQAGPIRNCAMLQLRPELVVAFPGGRGTADMVDQAKQGGIRVIMVDNSDLVS